MTRRRHPMSGDCEAVVTADTRRWRQCARPADQQWEDPAVRPPAYRTRLVCLQHLRQLQLLAEQGRAGEVQFTAFPIPRPAGVDVAQLALEVPS